MILDPKLGPPARYGIEQLAEALKGHNVSIEECTSIDSTSHGDVIAVGLSEWALLEQLNAGKCFALPRGAESLLIKRVSWKRKRVILIVGSDDKGTIYATLDAAKAVCLSSQNDDVLKAIGETFEKPEVAVRGICMFLHSEDLEKEWYYSEEFWRSYLHMLAEDRFNSFNLIFAHQTYYLAPPYPFLVEVEEYPSVKVTGLSDKQREKNLKTLQFISKLAEERAINFIMGIWQHRAWPFSQPSMVEGLTDENISEYSRLALAKVLRLCPSIKAIQLRVNPEAGIAYSKQLSFFRDYVFRAIKECGRPVALDLRVHGALPELIKAAEESGLRLRLSMKYWGEFMGPPYHPADFRVPYYCYQNFLRYPRKYDVWHQMWSLGSHRVLLWGDPRYVERFASSFRLGDAAGFEICAPLSQKGFGNELGNWRIFVSPELEYYKWEFERYWLFYLLFGRLTYNPKTSETIWMRELAKRFRSAAAPHVIKAYENGSKVISYLVAYSLSNYNMYIWPEKRIGGLIDYYIEAEPSDCARIYGFKEYVSSCLDDSPSAKMTPTQVSEYLKTVAASCLKAVGRAKRTADVKKNKEFAATVLDMQVLSGLAQYHAERVLAGEQLAFFYATGDLWALRRAKSRAGRALKIWMHIVCLTDGVYHPQMVFGPRDIGHWKDNIIFARHDVERLGELERLFERYHNFDMGFDFGKRPEEVPVSPTASSSYQPIIYNYSVERRFKGAYNDSLYDRKTGYGWLGTGGLESRGTASITADAWETVGLYTARRLGFRLYGNALYDDFVSGNEPAIFQVDLPNGVYDVTLIMKDEGRMKELSHGPMSIVIQGRKEVDSLLVSAGELVEHRCRAQISDGKLLIEFSCEPGKDWIVNGLTITKVGPYIAHIPKRKAILGKKIRIEATVTSLEELRRVALHYRTKTTTTYHSLSMRQEEPYCYIAEVPEEASKGTVEYYLEAIDRKGDRTLYPARGETEPVSLVVGKDDDFPKIHHDVVPRCSPGEPLVIRARVQDNMGLRFVRLHYRNLNAFEKPKTISMELRNSEYQATIPAADIAETWDMLYYIEAVNMLGNGTFFPEWEKETPYVAVRTH